MRLAWFRPATQVSERLDDTAALVADLRSDHEIECFDQSRAPDFVRLDFRRQFDVSVFELADTEQHAFVWPYLLHYPGVLRLRSLSLHESRSASLRRQRQSGDRAAELAFSQYELLGAPLLASRLAVVSDPHLAASLQRDYPRARLRFAPIGLGSEWGQSRGQSWGQSRGQSRGLTPGLTPIGTLARMSLVRRAVDRANYAGARLELLTDTSPERVFADAEIVVDLEWPASGEQATTLAAMAAGKPIIVLETERTARWPALDPQTWRPRGLPGEQPIVVSVDPRDEEHSLSLALRRLGEDEGLREALGTAAHAWWRTHATVAHAADAWREILRDAASLAPPPRPADWPAHLTADGTERARQILGELGTGVDFVR
ncbi:MAG TPA: hypothetical protein VI485_23845 [Vicinamibacterales bacterium]|nr:hypothetical protein [Vicinamibacterales bacterium]